MKYQPKNTARSLLFYGKGSVSFLLSLSAADVQVIPPRAHSPATRLSASNLRPLLIFTSSRPALNTLERP